MRARPVNDAWAAPQDPIPVNEPRLDGAEARYLAECLETGWISSDGPFVARFEAGVAAACGQTHGVAVTSGSAALELAMAALGVGPGDEVVMPAFTIISCAAAVVRAGATPVVVDCDPVTWNLDPRRLEAAITPRTRAIMPVHIYGLPVDMDPVMEVARRHGLRVIEDAAEQLGQTYRTHAGDVRPVGSFGDVATLSFYPNKHVTTGEGGMLLTGDDALAARARALRNLRFGAERRFVHEELGWNFRMSNLQAAVGVAQLERLEDTLGRKRRIGAWYDARLADVDGLERQPPRTAYAERLPWVYGVVLRDDVRFDAEDAMRRLGEAGIGTRPFFWPMHEQPALRRLGLFDGVRCPAAERIARRGFYLPSGVALTERQAERVAAEVRRLFE